ncbi:metal-dependent hydrolase family protein [Sphingomonas hankyongi]|uniref:Amidohydrolase family protein n=1 Tax=Sphingomonas hankyongi TaxID=2908209 RepID=A0ABT0S5C8_9SPHN|nr:amidohydrolase family protein [Sphingomonas hankyongi]MCL6730843.1 amidohydrolase family protein [Sphingomonas hankyongi]
MMRRLLAGALAAAIAPTAHAETYAIQAGRLIVDAARPARENSTIIVENGRIARIEDGFTAPAGATVVDQRTRTVMPGLIDVHVHLTQTSGTPWYAYYTQKYSNAYSTTLGLTHALEMARAGFTTVRDLGGNTASVIAVRDAVAEGRFPGPRIKVSGDPLSIIGGHADPATALPPELAAAVSDAHLSSAVCTGVEQCQEVVRKLAAAGVDVIKIMATGGVLDPGALGLEQHFTNEEMKAIVDMAHAMHLKVAAHAHGAGGILAATNAGVDSIEHGTFLDAAGAQAMKAHGTYYSATLMAFTGVQSIMGTGKLTPEMEAKARLTFDVWGKGLNLAYRSGVKIALGTDSAVAPHKDAAKELGLMVSKGGMTPRDALIAATKSGADLLNISNETGTLEVGKSADLIAVDGDPLADPSAVTHLGYVMVGGRPIPLQ